ncbi:MAG: PadR family transcriptional regulator [Rhizobiaceae bacterium]
MHHHCHQGHEDGLMRFMSRNFGGRHGFGPFGKGFGGGGGNMFRAGRMLADGDLRLIALSLIEKGPRHGYDLIKALEELSSGIYSPSPGVVYPTLTFLEEAGYATSTTDGNKKVFAITDAGRAHLEENREIVEGVLEQIERFGRKMAKAREWFDWADDSPVGRGRHERHAMRHEFHAVRRRLRTALAEIIDAPAETQKGALEILNRAADQLDELAHRDPPRTV